MDISIQPSPKRRSHWPTKADYKPISREDALSLVTEFCDLYGLDSLRAHNYFRQMTFSSAKRFDPLDLSEAIRIAINVLAARPVADNPMQCLWERLEAHCGALDQPVAIKIGNWPLVLVPDRALH